jgi:hypothetical protein
VSCHLSATYLWFFTIINYKLPWKYTDRSRFLYTKTWKKLSKDTALSNVKIHLMLSIINISNTIIWLSIILRKPNCKNNELSSSSFTENTHTRIWSDLIKIYIHKYYLFKIRSLFYTQELRPDDYSGPFLHVSITYSIHTRHILKNCTGWWVTTAPQHWLSCDGVETNQYQSLTLKFIKSVSYS